MISSSSPSSSWIARVRPWRRAWNGSGWRGPAPPDIRSLVPAGLLAWKLSGVAMRPSDLMLAFVTGVLAGTLVMAVLAPLLALYYNTSAWAGPLLAMGSTFAALAVAVVTFVRGAMRRRPPGVSRAGLLVPIVVVITMQLGTLLQFIAVAQSILPETTPFDGGIDRIVPR